MRKPKPQGKGIVKALHQKGTTGNFKKIEAAKGKGAAIGALQNKLAKIRGQKAPYGGKKKRKMTQAEDDAYDKKHGLKEGSRADLAQDKKFGIKDRKAKSMPQRKNHRSMSGKEMLAKGMKRMAGC